MRLTMRFSCLFPFLCSLTGFLICGQGVCAQSELQPPPTLQSPLLDIVAQKNSVLRVFAVKGQMYASGTGFVVSKSGLIVTNSHVVHNASEIAVYILLPNGKAAQAHTAKIVYDDYDKDLAILRIVAPPPHLPKPFLISETPADVLDEVVAIGFPSALDRPISVASNVSQPIVTDSAFIENLDPNVTRGAVSKVGSWLVHDAKISSGNSGGPLLSLKTGKVVGVNTAKTQGETQFYMAIPASCVLQLLESVNETIEASSEYRSRLEKGDVNAMISYAYMLYAGADLSQRDPNKALEIMKQAAATGNKQALCELGYMYSDNTYIKPDPDEAIRCLTESGTYRAKLRLCFIYIYGIKGTDYKGNPSYGFQYVQKNLNETDIATRTILAHCCRYGIGTEVDIQRAINLLRYILFEPTITEEERFMTEHELGSALIHTDEQTQKEEGLRILNRLTACENKAVKGLACSELGDLYFSEQNFKQAAFYYQLGTEVKEPNCMANLGHAYIKGIGIEKNPILGLSLVEEALERGCDKKAYLFLGEYYLAEKKRKEAVVYFRIAAEAGDDMSECLLAVMQYFGEGGIPQNKTQAYHKIKSIALRKEETPATRYAKALIARLPNGSAPKRNKVKPKPIPAKKSKTDNSYRQMKPRSSKRAAKPW